MCLSILPDEQAQQKYVEEDLKDPDPGFASSLGEDEHLVWTEKGVRSSLGVMGWGIDGSPVNDGFLRVQPLSVQDGLNLGYWKIENRTEKTEAGSSTSPSLMQTEKLEDGQCALEKVSLKECPPALKKLHKEACAAEHGWKFVRRNYPCLDEGATAVATPGDCLATVGQGDDPLEAWYFRYDSLKPQGQQVVCHTYTDKKCSDSPRKPPLPKKLAEQKRRLSLDKIWFWHTKPNP